MKFSPLFALMALVFATPAWSAGDAVAGESKAAVCGDCHGLDGNATDPQYPNLAGQHEAYIAQQLALFKSGARENAIMVAFASALSEQDMADVGAYFAKQARKPGIADDAYLAAGEKLYRGGDLARGIPACMACHGPDGRGNPVSRYPALSGQHAQYTVAILKRYRDGAVFGEPNDAHAKIMSQIAAKLTDADIEALASTVQGLHSASP